MSAENWFKAKASVPKCYRCDDWNQMGLSSRCPTCDGKIAEEFDRLEKERLGWPKISGKKLGTPS